MYISDKIIFAELRNTSSNYILKLLSKFNDDYIYNYKVKIR